MGLMGHVVIDAMGEGVGKGLSFVDAAEQILVGVELVGTFEFGAFYAAVEFVSAGR